MNLNEMVSGQRVSGITPGTGVVYAVEIDPEKHPSRIKVGWSTNLPQRLATYSTIAPDLRLIGFWPAERQCLERAALLVAKQSAAQVGPELFDDCGTLISELDALFKTVGVRNSAPSPSPTGWDEHVFRQIMHAHRPNTRPSALPRT